VCLLEVSAVCLAEEGAEEGDDCPGAVNPGFAELLITLETGTSSLSGSQASSIRTKSWNCLKLN
jgi:hypothetical protein